MNKKLLIIVLSIVLLGIAAYFFIPKAKPQIHEVVLGKSGFRPESITVAKGDSIVFKTSEEAYFWPASDPHPIHDRYSEFDPKRRLEPGESWTFTPNKIGEWEFHDHLFPAFRGHLTVLNRKDFDIRQRVLTRDEVTRMVEKRGPEETYKNLKRIYDSNLAAAHSTFHILGEVLYSKFGVSGVFNCDDFAGFGCYHGLVIRAVSEKGVDIAQEIDKKCVEQFGRLGLGCPHGIGHGLVEFFGYSNLEQALSICAKLDWQGNLFGCAGGVFMEYNFRSVYKDGTATIATREAHGNLFEPCRSISARFRDACYFEQASWWRETLNSDYARVGRFCSDLKNSEKDSCLLGLGNSVVESSFYDKELLFEACGKMPDKYSEAICRTGGAWAFFSNPDKRSQSESVCNGLGNYETTCLDRRILVGEK